jgi:putative spermidine/putrescine transport system permease protein
LGLAVGSTILALVLVAPTAYWVQLRIPKARPLLDILALLPFAVPPIVLSLGYLELFGSAPNWINILSLGIVPLLSNPPFTIADTQGLLIFAYVIISLPFMYRPIDNNLQAINTNVLSEAASSLGSNWWRTFFTVILPNIMPGIINAALLAFTTAMGEFTIASLSGIYTFPVFLNQTGQNDPHKAAWLTIVSFLIIIICTMVIILLARDRSSSKRSNVPTTTIEAGTGH